jgi:hypothetical protein
MLGSVDVKSDIGSNSGLGRGETGGNLPTGGLSAGGLSAGGLSAGGGVVAAFLAASSLLAKLLMASILNGAGPYRFSKIVRASV